MDQQHPDSNNASNHTAGSSAGATDRPMAAPRATDPAAASTETPASNERTISRSRWIAAAVAALGVALFAVPFLGVRDSGSGSHPGEQSAGGSTCSTPKGAADFDFTLKDVDGHDVQLSDYRGKVILLNFWATWCGPCKYEIPEFVEAYKQYRNRGFVILGVLSQDESADADVRDFAKRWGMDYPILREHAGLDEAFGPMFAIPTSFIIDRHGSICSKHLGPVPKDVLEQEIESLL